MRLAARKKRRMQKSIIAAPKDLNQSHDDKDKQNAIVPLQVSPPPMTAKAQVSANKRSFIPLINVDGDELNENNQSPVKKFNFALDDG